MEARKPEVGRPLDPNAVRWAAFIGYFVDMFDIYLPVIALAPAISYFQPPTLGRGLQNTIYYAVFATSLIGRPLGSLIFGHFADTVGRRVVALISVAGFTVVNLLIALLPGYDLIGLTGIVLLIILRLLDGIFLGGEYTGANTLAMEYTPKEKRGFTGAYITGAYAAASAAISLATVAVLSLVPAGKPDAPYVLWGWRIPFLFGVFLSTWLFFYFRRAIPESEVWQGASRVTSPVVTLARRGYRKALLQVFAMMTGVWLVFLCAATTLPRVLQADLRLNHTVVTTILIFANLMLFLGYLLFGELSQRYGRRRLLVIGGLLNAIATPFLYFTLARGEVSRAALIALVTAIEILAVAGTFAVPLSYLTERFPTEVRATGFGIGYSAAAILPSFYGFVMLWLSQWMAYKYAPLPLIAAGGLIMALGAAWGPETREVEMNVVLVEEGQTKAYGV